MSEQPRASRRERQILDILHRQGPSTVGDVLGHMDEAPTYSTVRTLLRIMEEKGLVVHTERGKAYVYAPAASAKAARRSALRHLVTTFFQGSAEDAAMALLDETGLDPATRKRLSQRIAQARREGR
jgi:predicted transcriptional regulator